MSSAGLSVVKTEQSKVDDNYKEQCIHMHFVLQSCTDGS